MGKDFREVRREIELADQLKHDTQSQSLRHLSEEVRDMRNAGRELESTKEEEATITGLVERIYNLEIDQRKNNDRLVKSMDRLLCQSSEILDEVEHVLAQIHDEKYSAQQAAISGVNRAQQEAEQNAIKNINRVTEKSTEYIEAMVQVAKRRIERLAIVTLSDKLFQTLKWIVLILFLFILSHIAYQLVM